MIIIHGGYMGDNPPKRCTDCTKWLKEELKVNEDVEPLPHSDMNMGDEGEINAPDDIAKLKQALEAEGGMVPNSQWNTTPFNRDTVEDGGSKTDDLIKLLPNTD